MRLFWRIAAGIGTLILVLAVVVAIRTILFGANATTAPDSPPPPPASAEAVERLAAALRIPTISYDTGVPEAAALDQFARYLRETFPAVHETLGLEVVAGHSLLYTWQGRDPSLKPTLLAAHMDVVPVEDGTDSAWTHPPFAGAVADGFVWGRGAWDDKFAITASLEAVDVLIAEGYVPDRTVYLAFGHDEEVGGSGALAMADLLQSRGVRLSMVLDEGFLVTEGILPGMSRAVALIGVSEKGYATVELVARGAGGHSSMPGPDNAVLTLARALERLDASPFPARLIGPVSAMFDSAGPSMSLGLQIVMANRWLTEPIVLAMLSRSTSTNASIRTTMAPTMLRAGSKENVLAQEAKATVNVRVLPGDTIDDVLAHVRAAVGDGAVEVRLAEGMGAWEPAPVSPMDGPAWETLAGAVRDAFPDALVAPGLTIAATDSRHYLKLADAVYRFVPIRGTAADLTRFHGTDERISIADYGAAIAFYRALISRASASAP